MKGNFPPGFEGFQARREAMVDLLGGDWLAQRATEDAWARYADGLGSEPALGLPERDFYQRWPHRSRWVTFDAASFDKAATIAERAFRWSELEEAAAFGHLDGFRVVIDARRIVRMGRDGYGVMLAHVWTFGRADDWSISFTDDGEAVCSARRVSIRTCHRHARSETAARKSLIRMADEMGVIRCTTP